MLIPQPASTLQATSHSHTRRIPRGWWRQCVVDNRFSPAGRGAEILEVHPCLWRDQMLGATAAGLQALPIQPLDGNNSPPLFTVTHSFISWMLRLILATVLSSANSNQPIYGFTVPVCVCMCCICPCWCVLKQGSETPSSFVLPTTEPVKLQSQYVAW